MKSLTITLFILSLIVPTGATEISFSQSRMNQFACVISKAIQNTYPEDNTRDLRQGILKNLREKINPWVDAYPIPAGFSLPRYVELLTGLPGFPMDRSEYYLQNAFILYGNPQLELKAASENYFASYIHLARTRHIAYLNGEEPKFQLREEDNLFQQIAEHLPTVANYAFPYLDNDGLPIQQMGTVAKGVARFTLAVGDPQHKKYAEFVYETQRFNKFASPLFVWLLAQEDFSVSPEELFAKALEIYEHPLVALGVIPWVFSGDALTVSRETSSVVSFKMERLVEGHDVPGLQYHFWGYLTQSIIGNRVRVGALAYIYEAIYQRDFPDWKVDVLALKLGQKIRDIINQYEECPQ